MSFSYHHSTKFSYDGMCFGRHHFDLTTPDYFHSSFHRSWFFVGELTLSLEQRPKNEWKVGEIIEMKAMY